MAVIKNKQIKNYPFDSTIQTSESKSQRILLTCTDGRIQKSEHWFWWAVCPGLLSEDRVGEELVAETVSAFHQSSPGEGLLRLNHWGWTVNHCLTVPNKCPLPSLPFITPYLGLLPQDHIQISAARGALWSHPNLQGPPLLSALAAYYFQHTAFSVCAFGCDFLFNYVIHGWLSGVFLDFYPGRQQNAFLRKRLYWRDVPGISSG